MTRLTQTGFFQTFQGLFKDLFFFFFPGLFRITEERELAAGRRKNRTETLHWHGVIELNGMSRIGGNGQCGLGSPPLPPSLHPLPSSLSLSLSLSPHSPIATSPLYCDRRVPCITDNNPSREVSTSLSQREINKKKKKKKVGGGEEIFIFIYIYINITSDR